MINIVCEYFFTFIIYSVAGWIMETLLFLIRDKKVVKRGFLFGPVCPIYGCGAVICTAVLYGKVNNIFLLFIYGLLLCGTLEYITHFVMEKMFHAMWWDYSSRRFNINGRVYLNGLLIFGAGAVLIVKVLQPLVFRLIGVIPQSVLYWICFIAYSILLVDFAGTISDLKGVFASVKHLQNTVITGTQKGVDLTREQVAELNNRIKENEFVSNSINAIKNESKIVDRMRNVFPNLTLKKYKYIWDIIMDKPQEENARKDIKLYGTAETIPDCEHDTDGQ